MPPVIEILNFYFFSDLKRYMIVFILNISVTEKVIRNLEYIIYGVYRSAC